MSVQLVSPEAEKDEGSLSRNETQQPMATHTNSRPPGMSETLPNRGHVVQARYQRFGFALFGALACLAALIFARWDPTTTDSRWFWVIVGPLAGVVAMFKSQTLFGSEGADRDAGPYVGMLIGTTAGSLVIGAMAFDGWVLSGVFFVVAGFLAFMAWLEQSGIGVTTALTITILAATTAVADISDSVVLLTLMIGVMLLASSAALMMTEDELGTEDALGTADELEIDLREPDRDNCKSADSEVGDPVLD